MAYYQQDLKKNRWGVLICGIDSNELISHAPSNKQTSGGEQKNSLSWHSTLDVHIPSGYTKLKKKLKENLVNSREEVVSVIKPSYF